MSIFHYHSLTFQTLSAPNKSLAVAVLGLPDSWDSVYNTHPWERFINTNGNTTLPFTFGQPRSPIFSNPTPPPLPGQTWIQRFELTNPNYQHDWPNPKNPAFQPIDQFWEQDLLPLLFLNSIPHNNYDWPVPIAPVYWDRFYEYNEIQFILQQPASYFHTYDFPNPRTYAPIDQFWESDLLPALFLGSIPHNQYDYPNPQPITWYRDWSINLQENTLRPAFQAPFFQTDWPNPYPVYWNLSWIDQGNSNLPVPTVLNTFRQSDWPNPQPITWYQWYSVNLLETTLAPAAQNPFVQTDWPNPLRTNWYQWWSVAGNVQLPFPTPFFQIIDAPLPVVPQPIDQFYFQNLSQFLQSETFPFHQTDYPNPYPVYWFRDYNQNLVIYLPVGTKPFNQNDWPLPKGNVPIDQYWFQALSLNLPIPPPPVITATGGRQVWPEELDDLSLATHKWHQRLIDASKFKIGNEIREAASAMGKRGDSSPGGIARAQSLTSQQRSNIASKAAQIRWQSPRR